MRANEVKTFEEFLKCYLDERARQKRRGYELRAGQTYMNMLYVCQPDLYCRIENTERDPFMLDKRVPKFLKFIQDNWKSI